MKALSIRQPWASLIVMGHKDVENRSWSTKYRGPLLVHAGHGRAVAAIGSIEEQYGLELCSQDLPRGGIIGVVELIDVAREHRSRWFDREGFAWVLANPRPLAFTPLRGRLGLFEASVRLDALAPALISGSRSNSCNQVQRN